MSAYWSLVKGLSTWDNFRERYWFSRPCCELAASDTLWLSYPFPGAEEVWDLPWVVYFFKKKGKGKKKILRSWLFQSCMREGRRLFACILLRSISHLPLWLRDVSSGRGWWQRLFCSGTLWSRSCFWWRESPSSPPPPGSQLPLGKCFHEQYLGWHFGNHITACYKSLWHEYS